MKPSRRSDEAILRELSSIKHYAYHLRSVFLQVSPTGQVVTMANLHVFLLSAIFVVIVSLLPSLLVPVEAKFSLAGLSTDVFSSQGLHTFRLLAERTPFGPLSHSIGHHPPNVGHHVRCHVLSVWASDFLLFQELPSSTRLSFLLFSVPSAS